MIEFLHGTLSARLPARLIISVGGVGFGVDVSLRTSEKYTRVGEPIEMLTYLHVKEDLLELYGFSDAGEREIFMKLLDVSGIGPRLALRILSATTPSQLADLILKGNVSGLMALKGIGKKTAEVMIASLRNAMGKMDFSSTPGQAGTALPANETWRDAILALMSLGVKEAQAQSAVEKAVAKLGDKAGTHQIITQALQEV